MADCECLPGCPFFHDELKDMPAMAEHVKQRYCKRDWAECARYRIFKARGRDAVPGDLYPYQSERADEILR